VSEEELAQIKDKQELPNTMKEANAIPMALDNG